MATIPRSRTLNVHRDVQCLASVTHGSDVVLPMVFVEIDGQESAVVIGQERIDTHDMLAFQMGQNSIVRDGAVRAISSRMTAHMLYIADSSVELIGAFWHVP